MHLAAGPAHQNARGDFDEENVLANIATLPSPGPAIFLILPRDPFTDMKVLIVVPPENFRDEELAGPIAEFEKAGIQYDIASTKKGVCRGMLGARATASLSLEEVEPSVYAGIVIVGGSGSPVHLWNSDLLVQLVKYFSKSNRLVAAICLSPVVLARAGILKGKKATCFESPPATKEMLRAGADLSAGPVVVDGNVITANGPAAAGEFAGAVVRALKG